MLIVLDLKLDRGLRCRCRCRVLFVLNTATVCETTGKKANCSEDIEIILPLASVKGFSSRVDRE